MSNCTLTRPYGVIDAEEEEHMTARNDLHHFDRPQRNLKEKEGWHLIIRKTCLKGELTNIFLVKEHAGFLGMLNPFNHVLEHERPFQRQLNRIVILKLKNFNKIFNLGKIRTCVAFMIFRFVSKVIRASGQRYGVCGGNGFPSIDVTYWVINQSPEICKNTICTLGFIYFKTLHSRLQIAVLSECIILSTPAF